MEIELPPPNRKYLPFRRAKTVVQCISAGQLTGPRTICELLLIKKMVTDTNLFTEQILTPPKCVEATSQAIVKS